MVLSLLLPGLGIAIVNDFKSIEGDCKMGLQSLPVAFGVDTGVCGGGGTTSTWASHCPKNNSLGAFGFGRGQDRLADMSAGLWCQVYSMPVGLAWWGVPSALSCVFPP